jgi:hypothetical protein
LTQTVEPKCASCNTSLTLDFIASVTPKVFHNQEYREYRSKILLSKEKSLLPATQHLAEQEMQVQKINEKIKVLHDKELELKKKIRDMRTDVRILDMERYRLINGHVKKENKSFIQPCPSEQCRGFLSSAWKCGTCQQYSCPECHVIKTCKNDPTHVCDENTKKTIALLKTDTKPCPKCTAPIHKISGCHQIWCVKCHTAFDWKTGRIETGVIHNPHYYAWQREQNNGVAPRVAGDNPELMCARLPRINEIQHILKQRKQDFKHLINCLRLPAHIRAVVMPKYPTQMGILDNTDLRIDFLLNKFDEKHWNNKLKARLKKQEKNREVYHVLELVCVTLNDIFNNFIREENYDLIKTTSTLLNYVNNEFNKIKMRYNNTCPFIYDNWLIK